MPGRLFVIALRRLSKRPALHFARAFRGARRGADHAATRIPARGAFFRGSACRLDRRASGPTAGGDFLRGRRRAVARRRTCVADICQARAASFGANHLRGMEGGTGPLLQALCVAGAGEHMPRRVRGLSQTRGATRSGIGGREVYEKIGLSARAVGLRDPVSRWGSCSAAGSLNFSWRLVMAPPFVLNYLAAHEVAHLVHLDHSPRFWALAHELCSEVDRAEAWLVDARLAASINTASLRDAKFRSRLLRGSDVAIANNLNKKRASDRNRRRVGGRHVFIELSPSSYIGRVVVI